MLADPRSEALVDALRRAVAAAAGSREDSPRLPAVPAIRRHARRRRCSARRSCFFDSIVREDRQRARPADGRLHVRERAARASTTASRTSPAATFQRVQLPEYRRGLLGQGSILTLTSVADRTSPVQRGKWVLEVLLGTPPPPPPPNVPALDDDQGDRSAARCSRHARAHGRAPQEPGVHVVPPRDRSARPGARELRRRPARGASRTTKCRSIRSAISTTARR